MMARKKGQEVQMELVKPDKVQRQIKALQRRIKALEYDIIDIRMKIKPVNEIRHIGFIQHSNLHSDNDYNNE